MSSEYSGFRNWWRPISDYGVEYLPEFSPVRLWPEILSPMERSAPHRAKEGRSFFDWWVAPES